MGESSTYILMDPKCAVCEKTAYATERIMVNGKAYHKPCFRCTHCKSVLKWVDLSMRKSEEEEKKTIRYDNRIDVVYFF